MNQRPRKVFLVSQPSVSATREHRPKNMDALYEHGEVHVLVQAGERPTFHPERVMRLIRQRLASFDPVHDCIASAGGDPLAAIMVGMVLSDMSADADLGFNRITYLRYDRPQDPRTRQRTHEGASYVPMEVPMWVEEAEA